MNTHGLKFRISKYAIWILRTRPQFPNEVFYEMEPKKVVDQPKLPSGLQVFDDAVDRLFKGSGRHLYILRNIVGQ